MMRAKDHLKSGPCPTKKNDNFPNKCRNQLNRKMDWPLRGGALNCNCKKDEREEWNTSKINEIEVNIL